MAADQQDEQGNFVNRFAKDGALSPLSFFQGNGWPTFCLHTQLRMGKGLFDLCNREVYSITPLVYGQGTDISLSRHACGRTLEAYLHRRFRGISRPSADTFAEFFVHCKNTTCELDEVSRSKLNPGQVQIALDFICDLVEEGVSPIQITVITPYKANRDCIETVRRGPKYVSLASMPPASTVDGFQGRENDIIIAILGTTRESGPGFTTNQSRLNVMFSRQRSGLVIFGDINLLGNLTEPSSQQQRQLIRAKGRQNKMLISKDGGTSKRDWANVGMLGSVLESLWRSGRFGTASQGDRLGS